jgi:hypothetical protein
VREEATSLSVQEKGVLFTLSLGEKKQVVRYESLTGYYPSSWRVGSEIRVRLQGKGKMFLLDQTEEVPSEIVNAGAGLRAVI